jgi:hypothetical protein
MINHCSPSQQANFKKNNSCYDEDALYKIIEAFNRNYPTNTINIVASGKQKSFSVLWSELQMKLADKCDKNELCWVSHLGIENDKKISTSLRPPKPIDWNNDPNTWLNNFNIEAVLIQYEEANKPFYKFYGVYSSDFLRKSNNVNVCYHRELCAIDIVDLYEKGTRALGFVINLDEHDEPGSHWTSVFAIIDPTMPCFGVYYYDSTTNDPPNDMSTFMKELQVQGNKMKKKYNTKYIFKNKINKVQHQFKNTECGVFSIYNQVKWLHEIKKKNGNITFSQIIKENIKDEQMSNLRKILFRPI